MYERECIHVMSATDASPFEGVGSIEQGRLYEIFRRNNDDPRRI